ncbi:MAG: peptide chain release factor N(5)-glutamine methyltransferase [Candidatus Dormibacteraeota bacterium]|nr:peptide chain release factor N(5)-glutamine methyltransferase [Candidatus Dormibacteraeota bacterium]
MTLLEVLKRATGYLETHGSASPRLDAEVLLAHVLGLRRLDLYLQFDRPLDEAQLAPYRELTARRGQGQPVAYLTGHREFMALDFTVTPAVLVPNPDTEVLVQRAVDWGRLRGGGPLRFADVGTGSGCIAIAVAHYLPEATVDATDSSEGALKVAAANAERLGVADRVRFLCGDLAEPLAERYDALLANLPYVVEGAVLPAEVTAQPGIALFGGSALVNRLLQAAPALLAPGGIALLEVDPAITAELALGGFAGSKLLKDLGGHDRVLEAWI